MAGPPKTTWQLGVLFLCLAGAPTARAEPWARALGASLGATADESLSRAARTQAEAIARAPQAPPDDIRWAIAREGLADAQLETFAAIGDAAALRTRAEVFARGRAAALGPTRLGLGRARAADGRAVLVVVWSRRLIELPPLSARVPRRAMALTGTVLSRPGIESEADFPAQSGIPQTGSDRPGTVRAFMTTPSGRVRELEVTRKGRRVSVQAPLDAAAGRYDVEWLVETARGPEVGALWRFAVEVPPASAAVVPEGLESAADVVTTVDGWRRSFALPPTTAVSALSRAAERHAAEVCARGVAAHVTDSGGPEARARAAGWRGDIAENIAIGPTLGQAHAQLLASPSHRLNLMLPGPVSMGVGVARAEGRRCLVELFGLSGNRPTASR